MPRGAPPAPRRQPPRRPAEWGNPPGDANPRRCRESATHAIAVIPPRTRREGNVRANRGPEVDVLDAPHRLVIADLDVARRTECEIRPSCGGNGPRKFRRAALLAQVVALHLTRQPDVNVAARARAHRDRAVGPNECELPARRVGRVSDTPLVMQDATVEQPPAQRPSLPGRQTEKRIVERGTSGMPVRPLGVRRPNAYAIRDEARRIESHEHRVPIGVTLIPDRRNRARAGEIDLLHERVDDAL